MQNFVLFVPHSDPARREKECNQQELIGCESHYDHVADERQNDENHEQQEELPEVGIIKDFHVDWPFRRRIGKQDSGENKKCDGIKCEEKECWQSPGIESLLQIICYPPLLYMHDE